MVRKSKGGSKSEPKPKSKAMDKAVVTTPPKVEGTLVDGGYKNTRYCDENCNHCGVDIFNIPTNRVSLCPNCGEEQFPCSACKSDKIRGHCGYIHRLHSCHRFSHTKEWVEKMERRKAGTDCNAENPSEPAMHS